MKAIIPNVGFGFMTAPFPEPTAPAGSRAEVFVRYLDYFRNRVRAKLRELRRPGERWAGEPPATLERVLFHLVQEYARHLGHLDIVCELAGAPAGE
jgi:hypothetical protein